MGIQGVSGLWLHSLLPACCAWQQTAYNENVKQNWNQFLLVLKAIVNATAQKQQIGLSTFYPQIQRIDASHHIYVSQWPVVYLEFADKILIFVVLERWLLQLRKTDSSFVL